jgi:aldehyde dehydrogenase (NAD+)
VENGACAEARDDRARDRRGAAQASKDDLGALVSMEMGKIAAEGRGEVQEMIDVADFAVGLSRQLYGLSMHSERPLHRMYEQWHPLGAIGVITAFNFPVAVWSWNALIALVCGDTVVWKPSSKTPLTAVAVQHICNRVLARHGWTGVCNLLIGSGRTVGDRMLKDKRLPLISLTGSTGVGRQAAQIVGERLGRTLLELGGNNGIIVMDDANLDLVVRAVLVRRGRHFGAAVHLDPARVPAQEDRCDGHRAVAVGLCSGTDREPVRSRHADGSAGG